MEQGLRECPLLGDDLVLSLTTLSVGLVPMTPVGGTCLFVWMGC